MPESRLAHRPSAEDMVRVILDTLGLDTNDPHLRDSPARYLDTMRELLAGVSRDAGAPLRKSEPTPTGTRDLLEPD